LRRGRSTIAPAGRRLWRDFPATSRSNKMLGALSVSTPLCRRARAVLARVLDNALSPSPACCRNRTLVGSWNRTKAQCRGDDSYGGSGRSRSEARPEHRQNFALHAFVSGSRSSARAARCSCSSARPINAARPSGFHRARLRHRASISRHSFEDRTGPSCEAPAIRVREPVDSHPCGEVRLFDAETRDCRVQC
jgi:hypothetical protein